MRYFLSMFTKLFPRDCSTNHLHIMIFPRVQLSRFPEPHFETHVTYFTSTFRKKSPELHKKWNKLLSFSVSKTLTLCFLKPFRAPVQHHHRGPRHQQQPQRHNTQRLADGPAAAPLGAATADAAAGGRELGKKGEG